MAFSSKQQRKIEKLLETTDVLDALDAGLVDEAELRELGLDEDEHYLDCGIDAIRQRRIRRALADYGEDGVLENELVTVEELHSLGYETKELPPDLDDEEAMQDYWERNG